MNDSHDTSSTGMLVLDNVVKIFTDDSKKTVTAVDRVSFTVNKGEFITLLGPSGCGKTTLLRILAGFEQPDSGEIFFNDQNITTMPAYKRNMPMVFQSYALFPHLSLFDNIGYGLKVKKMSGSLIKDEVEMAMQLVNLTGLESRMPREISGGQQQRVALARALVMKPKIILFDEPLSNLDAKLRVQTRKEIKRVQQTLGVTAVYVTHDQDEALSMSDRIIVMDNGKISQIGDPETIYQNPANVFVADFIGKSNFLDATVANVENDHIDVTLSGARFTVKRAPSLENIAINEIVLLCVKPDAVKIGSDLSQLKGKIYSTAFLGSEIEFEIECCNTLITTQLHKDEAEHLPRKVGSEVGIGFDENKLLFFKKT